MNNTRIVSILSVLLIAVIILNGCAKNSNDDLISRYSSSDSMDNLSDISLISINSVTESDYSKSDSTNSLSGTSSISINTINSSRFSLSESRNNSTITTSTSANSITSSTISPIDRERELNKIMNGVILKDDSYNLDAYTQAYWDGGIVYNESVYPMNNVDGSVSSIPLLYYVDKIISVRSSDLATLYTEGVDYILQNGKLVILSNSRIYINKYSDYYLDTEIRGQSFKRKSGGYLFFSEGSTFHKKQIAVTYAHVEKWNGPLSNIKGNKLPNLMQKLSNKTNINIVYYGDSITVGGNSSGYLKIAPFAPIYADMFSKALEKKYGVTVTSVNSSMGGKTSNAGLLYVEEKVNAYSPDLVVIAFGMNDGTRLNNVSNETYENNIKGIISAVKSKNPQAEFIVVGTTLPNPELIDFDGLQSSYQNNLQNIENTVSYAVFANVTQIHDFLLKKKGFYDMTANNVNHANDFLARVYVQVLLKTIEKN